MSQENVEIIRGSTEYFRRTGELLWDVIDPEMEIHDHDVPDGDVFRGHAGRLEWEYTFVDAWEHVSVEPEEYIDAGGDKVVLLHRSRLTAEAASRSNGRTALFTPFATARLCEWTTTEAALKPSKLWGCGSRRCRRRTSRSFGACRTPTTARDVGAMLDELHPEVEWHPWLQLQVRRGGHCVSRARRRPQGDPSNLKTPSLRSRPSKPRSGTLASERGPSVTSVGAAPRAAQ